MFALVPERSAFGERELRALLLASAVQAGGLMCDVVNAFECAEEGTHVVETRSCATMLV